ncbi:MAG: hypothetical protein ACLPY1_21980 [Terracidiphilus sp.]
MDQEIREKMVLAVENAVLVAGAKDYETGMVQASKLVASVLNGVASIQTKDGLRTTLDSCSAISKREEKLVLLGLKMLPQVLRIGLKMAAQLAASTLPQPPGGRPRASNAAQTHAVQSYILELIGKGCSAKAAKDRAAQKFGLSQRTIHRLWSSRENVPEDEPGFKDVIGYISTGK